MFPIGYHYRLVTAELDTAGVVLHRGKDMYIITTVINQALIHYDVMGVKVSTKWRKYMRTPVKT